MHGAADEKQRESAFRIMLNSFRYKAQSGNPSLSHTWCIMQVFSKTTFGDGRKIRRRKKDKFRLNSDLKKYFTVISSSYVLHFLCYPIQTSFQEEVAK